jgi:hypothetical protein
MELQQLRDYARTCINDRPELRDEIVGLWELCLDEIQESGSRQHEINLCHSDIKELMERDC